MPPRVRPGLARHARLKVLEMLARLQVLVGLDVVPVDMLAHSDTLADPDGA